MKKPEWFELIDNDYDDPYVGNKIPFIVLLAIVIVVSGFIFLFPFKAEDTVPLPAIEIIQTPIDPIQMPTKVEDNEDGDDGDDD
jgi:hypothetical protein